MSNSSPHPLFVKPVHVLRKMKKAFTIMEALGAVALIGIVSALVLPTFFNTSIGVSTRKQQMDVAKLNAAVANYQLSGGQIPATADAQDVVNLLKTSVKTSELATHVGNRGSFLDPRTVLYNPTTADNDLNYVQDVGKYIEWVYSDGAKLVKSFRITENPIGTSFIGLSLDTEIASNDAAALAAAENTRKSVMAYDKPTLPEEGSWVWKNADSGNSGRTRGGSITPEDFILPDLVSNAAPIQLSPPVFSEDSGVKRPDRFTPTMPLRFTNPNPAGSSQIIYRMNLDGNASYEVGPRRYFPLTDVPIPQTRRSSVIAFCRSIDPVTYISSAEAREDYEAHVFTGTSVCNWVAPGFQPNAQVHSTVAPTASTNQYRWGRDAHGTPKNSLLFVPSPFASVFADRDFSLGTLTYYNGTTTTDTNINNVTLQINLNVTEPDPRPATIIDYRLNVTSTQNNTGTADGDADRITLDNPNGSLQIVFDGITYNLRLRFGTNNGNGFTTATTFNAHETSSFTGEVVGKFVPQ